MTRKYLPGIGACCVVLIAAVLFAGTWGRASAQQDPSTLPLLTESALQYVGGFRLPAGEVNGADFSFGGRVAAVNPAGPSLFVSSYRGAVAEISIPTPVNSADVKALPSASYVQPFADPTDGHLGDISSVGVNITGLLVSGNRLYGAASIYYDANNTQRVSHFSRSLQLNQPSFSGWSRVWEEGKSGFVSGMMALVPSEWQAKLGGPAVTGQCCIPIVSRTSNGPAAFAFDPAKIGQPIVSASPLLYYTMEHATLGSWEGSNPTYGATTQIQGMAIVAGTRSLLYFGSNGTGVHCYGDGTSDKSLDGKKAADGSTLCYDPTTNSKGSHAFPYRSQVWAYDLNDLAAVKAGKKKPWQVVPYGVWTLTFPTPEPSMRLGGVGYDAQRNIIYVAQSGADPDVYSNRPVMHAFRIAPPTRAQ